MKKTYIMKSWQIILLLIVSCIISSLIAFNMNFVDEYRLNINIFNRNDFVEQISSDKIPNKELIKRASIKRNLHHSYVEIKYSSGNSNQYMADDFDVTKTVKNIYNNGHSMKYLEYTYFIFAILSVVIYFILAILKII